MSNNVSICIPTYNGEKYIKETLESVLSQTIKDIEILVVDDGSTDNTMRIIREYSSQDNRIRIEQNEKNLGLVNNWNRCVELADGNWIKFVFQDDTIAPDCVARLLDSCKGGSLFAACRRKIFFDENAGSVEAYYKRYIDSITVEKIFRGETVISPEMFRSACLKYLGANIVGEPTAILLDKRIFKKYGYFNPNLIQMCDIEFWIRIGIHEGFTYVPDSLATFRVHSDGTSFINRKKRYSRMRFLDNIIVHHEFAFNPQYKPLRDTAFNHIPQINFVDLLIYHVHEVVKMLESIPRDTPEYLELYAEWQDVAKIYPVLLELPVKGIPRIMHGINRRLRRLYYNKVYR